MEGLEKFRESFAEFSDNYVVIGGTACDIAMTGTVVRPRATLTCSESQKALPLSLFLSAMMFQT